MRKILVTGVPWSTGELVPAVRDAATLGARLVVVDVPAELDKVDSAIDCDRVAVSSFDPESVTCIASSVEPDQVVSITEMAMVCAAEVRKRLSLKGTPTPVERAVSDKLVTRELLRRHGLTDVAYWPTTIAGVRRLVATLPLPVVVKPRALTGSVGVRLVRDPADLDDFSRQYEPRVAAKFGRDRLLVEEFIPGVEISAEAMAVDGRLVLLALTDKVNSGPPYFVEIGHTMPSRHTERWGARVGDYLQRCVAALGIRTSPLHAELKLLPGSQVELVEVHTRYGGDNIIRLLEGASGYRAFEAYFAAVLDEVIPASPMARQAVGVGFFTGGVNHPFICGSLDFPHPDTIVEIDLDCQRRPKLLAYEGVRLRHWRAGHVLFASQNQTKVQDNVAFIQSQFGAATSGAGIP